MRKMIFVAVGLAACFVAAAQSESGNVCVQDYQGGAVCTANDVRIEQLRVLNVDESCGAGVAGEFQVDLQAVLSANGSPNRYDIGFFLAQESTPDQEPAKTGDSCYHSFLHGAQTATPSYADVNPANGVNEVVDGPWWDGATDLDSCGDIETNTEVVITLDENLRFPCIDENADDVADIHACASWDNNTAGTCSTVADAFPGTNSKCGCSWVSTVSDIVVDGVPCEGNCSPAPVDLQSFSIQ